MVPFNFMETHHLYYGIILVGLAIVLRKAPERRWFWLCFISGLYMIADDICYHTGGLHALFVYLWGITGWAWPFGAL